MLFFLRLCCLTGLCFHVHGQNKILHRSSLKKNGETGSDQGNKELKESSL